MNLITALLISVFIIASAIALRTESEKFTYFVGLKNEANLVFCGACFISERHALAPGHCLYSSKQIKKPKYGGLYVVAGISKTNKHGTKYTVKYIEVHKDYKPKRQSSSDDIGLITLNDPVSFSEYITKVDLPKSDIDPGRTDGKIIEWDSVDGKIKLESLKLVSIRTLESHQCQAVIGNRLIFRNQMCGTTKSGETLNLSNNNNLLIDNNTVIGILSQVPSRKNLHTSIYTNVHYYLPYIEEAKTRGNDANFEDESSTSKDELNDNNPTETNTTVESA